MKTPFPLPYKKGRGRRWRGTHSPPLIWISLFLSPRIPHVRLITNNYGWEGPPSGGSGGMALGIANCKSLGQAQSKPQQLSCPLSILAHYNKQNKLVDSTMRSSHEKRKREKIWCFCIFASSRTWWTLQPRSTSLRWLAALPELTTRLRLGLVFAPPTIFLKMTWLLQPRKDTMVLRNRLRCHCATRQQGYPSPPHVIHCLDPT
jgi:hypothetical protein